MEKTSSNNQVFYHLYVCPWLECLKAANPVSGSWHQRGLNLATSVPRRDVKCPGCGKPMVIGRDGLNEKGNALPEHIGADRDGNAILYGREIIQLAPGQPDQTKEIQEESA